MRPYLLDTNICIYFNKGAYGLRDKLALIGMRSCCISEITYAELLFGVEKSTHRERNQASLDLLMIELEILPISPALAIFASEKARLKFSGEPVDNFDLLIGATAIAHGMTLVTNNTKHFQRLKGIKLEDWTR